MDTLVDTSGQAIARRIQLERKARGWTITDLAARSDVSRAAISKIERGEMSPTANVLVRLAGAFELTLAGLLLRAERPEGGVHRAADQPLWEDPESGYVRRQLFRSGENPIELARIILPPETTVSLPGAATESVREVIHVLDGVLTLTDAGEEITLEPGDSYALVKIGDVTFANKGSVAVTYLVALSRP